MEEGVKKEEGIRGRMREEGNERRKEKKVKEGKEKN